MIEDIIITDAFNVERTTQPEKVETGVQVQWRYGGNHRKFQVSDKKNHSLIFCAARNGNDLVFIYGSLEGISSEPGACILEPDGSVRVILQLPELMSKEYIDFQRLVGKEAALRSRKFINFFVKQPNVFICIGFNYDWMEVREFNSSNGQIGKCVFVTKT